MKGDSIVSPLINKRGDLRLITILPIGLTLKNRQGNEIGVFQLINISCNGLSAVIANHLNVGTELSVKLKLPKEPTHSIRCKATVRRCEELKSHEDHLKQYLCGLSIEINLDEKNELDKFINDVVNEGSGVIDRRNSSRIKNGLVFSNPAKYSTFRLSHHSRSIQIHQLNKRDLDELVNVEVQAWGKDMCATKEMLKTRLEVFPEGMIGARKDGKLMGYVGLMMIKSSLCDRDFTWMGITDGGYIRGTHDNNGDCLYGVSLSVIPTAPKDLAVKLLKAAGKLSIRMALKGILLGCRIPNFHKYAKRMTVDEYISATTKTGRIIDPELAMYRQLNAVPVRPVKNYFEDPDSLNYGLLVFWNNPFYEIQKNEFPFFFKSVTVDFT